MHCICCAYNSFQQGEVWITADVTETSLTNLNRLDVKKSFNTKCVDINLTSDLSDWLDTQPDTLIICSKYLYLYICIYISASIYLYLIIFHSVFQPEATLHLTTHIFSSDQLINDCCLLTCTNSIDWLFFSFRDWLKHFETWAVSDS